MKNFDFVFERIENPRLFFKNNEKSPLFINEKHVNYAWVSHTANRSIIIDLVEEFSWSDSTRIVINEASNDIEQEQFISELYNQIIMFEISELFKLLPTQKKSDIVTDLRYIYNAEYNAEYVVVEIITEDGNISGKIQQDFGFYARHISEKEYYIGINYVSIPREIYTSEIEAELKEKYNAI